MGDRGNIRIIDRDAEGEIYHDIYLYSHWFGSDLKDRLAEALAYEKRWNDAAYLTRIIHDEMVNGAEKFTGYGIQNASSDGRLVATVDVSDRTVKLIGGTTFTFNEFVSKFCEGDA